jgi:5-formyltetrahydrofolate cyclo-ligase
LKNKRRQLPTTLQSAYSWQLCQRLRHHPRLRAAQKIALYFPCHGEVDARPLIKLFPKKRFFLPHLRHRQGQALRFRAWGHRRLKKGAFGIPMPVTGRWWRAKQLDVLIVPLLAFDSQHNRLGMGKGFYDRTLAFRGHSALRQPYLLGLAYPFQKQADLPSKPWDVPLDDIAYL